MSKNITLSTDAAKNYLYSVMRFHYLIFILGILGGVAYTVLTINVIVNTPSDEAYRAQQANVLLNDSFDTTTVKKLKELNYSSDPQSVSLPPGRTNPFAE